MKREQENRNFRVKKNKAASKPKAQATNKTKTEKRLNAGLLRPNSKTVKAKTATKQRATMNAKI